MNRTCKALITAAAVTLLSALASGAFAQALADTVGAVRVNARESVFVIFRRPASTPSRTLPRSNVTTLATVSGPWAVSFPPSLGAPSKIELAQLASWTTHANEGVKYFSGTATYTTTVRAPRAWFRPGAKVLLNLGAVYDLAEVSINDKALGTLWKSPYELDVTGVLKPGVNRLEIRVTNEWTNRLIGDRSAPPEKKVLSATTPAGGIFGAPTVLSESGLLGPVTISSLTSR